MNKLFLDNRQCFFVAVDKVILIETETGFFTSTDNFSGVYYFTVEEAGSTYSCFSGL